ncbi:hypothetical protein EGW08_010212 [Elysia chlorotica]|uniref:Uncharacterized protein n=1 Tax=Elysia chlorotica TaxID=188477 RepID=A0A433TKH7_ELYCH|nr:hypothetical protein EGW08_010212 [Elysia chlorotica]
MAPQVTNRSDHRPIYLGPLDMDWSHQPKRSRHRRSKSLHTSHCSNNCHYNSAKMMKQLVIIAALACAVLADNYNCGKKGDVFECFESAAADRFCLTGGAAPVVVCGKCRKKADYCTKGLKKSSRPEVDCGPDFASTPCTTANSAVPAFF